MTTAEQLKVLAARFDAQSAAFDATVARIEALLTVKAPTVKAAAGPTLAERRAVGSLCIAHDATCGMNHDGRYATVKGIAYHVEHSGGAF